MRNSETKRRGSLHIDGEVKLGRLLDWDVGRLRPVQNLVDQFGGAAKQVRVVWSIGNQTSWIHVFPHTVYHRQSRTQRQAVDATVVGVYKRVGTDIKPIGAALEQLKGGRDVVGSPDFR